MLEQRIKEWAEKVIATYNNQNSGIIEVGKMMIDIDKIVSEEFGSEPFFEENA